MENRDRERTFVYFVQLAHRGRGEKKKERRIGADLTSCTGKTEGQKSPMSEVSVSVQKQKISVKTVKKFQSTPGIQPRTLVSVEEHYTLIPPPLPP